jgi:phosphoglycerate kinase
MKNIKEVNLTGKRVILRAEFNVPIKKGKILDDTRIMQSIKTIKYILDQRPKVLLLVSHLGRPEGKFVPDLSLEPVRLKLEKRLNQKIIKIDKLEELDKVKNDLKGIFLLENIRFWSEEKDGDEDFSRSVAEGFDIYINDCFSASHRTHASLVGFPKFTKEKCAGLLFFEEYEKLCQVRDNPKHPAVMIIGGAKIETKLPVIENVKKIYDFILVGGMIANEALDRKMNLGEKVILPVDFSPKEKIDQRLDIGPATLVSFEDKINAAKTIVWNGPPGKFEDEDAANGTKKVIEAIVQNKEALKVIGGGETLEAVKKFSRFELFDYVSMSGGAMLEFLSGKELPGIKALE